MGMIDNFVAVGVTEFLSPTTHMYHPPHTLPSFANQLPLIFSYITLPPFGQSLHIVYAFV